MFLVPCKHKVRIIPWKVCRHLGWIRTSQSDRCFQFYDSKASHAIPLESNDFVASAVQK